MQVKQLRGNYGEVQERSKAITQAITSNYVFTKVLVEQLRKQLRQFDGLTRKTPSGLVPVAPPKRGFHESSIFDFNFCIFFWKVGKK